MKLSDIIGSGAVGILHLWQQAQRNHTQLAALHGYGWTRDKDGNLDIYWDKEENRYKVKSRVALLVKGYSCVALTDVDAGRVVKLVVLAADVSTIKTLIKVNKEKE